MTPDSTRNMIRTLISIQGRLCVIITSWILSRDNFLCFLCSRSLLLLLVLLIKQRKSFFNFPQFFCHLCMWKYLHGIIDIQFFSIIECASLRTEDWSGRRAYHSKVREKKQIKIRSYYDYASYDCWSWILNPWALIFILSQQHTKHCDFGNIKSLVKGKKVEVLSRK